MLKEESNKPEKRRQAKDQKAVGSKRQEMLAVIAGGVVNQSVSTLPPEEASASIIDEDGQHQMIMDVDETGVDMENMNEYMIEDADEAQLNYEPRNDYTDNGYDSKKQSIMDSREDDESPGDLTSLIE